VGARGAGGCGEAGHQAGESTGREGVLARVGGEGASEEELEGLPVPELGGLLGGAPAEGDGGQEPGGGRGQERGGGPGSAAGSGGGARPGGDRLLQLPGQQRGQALVGAVAHVQPQGGAVVDQQQRPAGVQQGGDRARRVTGEVLPDAFAQGHL